MLRVIVWARSHKIWSTLIAAVVALFLIGSLAPPEETPDRAGDAPDRPTAETSTPSPSPSTAAPTSRPARDAGDAARKDARGTKPRRQASPAPTRTPVQQRRLYPVVHVADGDTVTVSYRGRDESVRIIGIDSPEHVDPNTPDECWGARASSAATSMLTGRRVALVFDPTQGRRDAYGRLLAYVQVPGLGDFGLAQLRRGNAVEYTYDTAYQRQARYRSAERTSRSTGKGLWAPCGGADKPLRLAPEPVKPKPKPAGPRPGGACAPGYRPCVPPSPPDVDCSDVDGPVYVTGTDPHELDSDGDGIACES